MRAQAHVITPQRAGSLPGLFTARAVATPDAVAYRWYENGRWMEARWGEMLKEAGRYRAALAREGLPAGERVAIMLKNCREWVLFEQAALSLGLVVVPVYSEDRAENAAFVLRDSQTRVLLIQDAARWRAVAEVDALPDVIRVIVPAGAGEGDEPRVQPAAAWLDSAPHGEFAQTPLSCNELATIVYTSGTTGRPKGVMLSHANILENAYACSQCVELRPDDLFLSFLPLSHMLERTAGHYLPMMVGAVVAYNRAVPQLADDLRTLKPQALISVPRIYERMHAKIMETLSAQPAHRRWMFRLAVNLGWRKFQFRQSRALWHPGLLLWPLLKKRVADPVLALLGGRLRFAISGGAALPAPVARTFVALGAPILQGYGLTEASPVVSVNRPQDNVPDSIGLPLPGVQLKLGPNGELWVQGASVMQGYWNNPKASAETLSADGWLRTGDLGHIDERGRAYITGRIKDIIVLSSGEKVPEGDLEAAILEEPLIEQALVIGESRPYLSALLVVNDARLAAWAQERGIDGAPGQSLSDARVSKAVLDTLAKRLKNFPGYAKLRRIALVAEPWTVENGLLTPTLKRRRAAILKKYADTIQELYRGHGT